MDKVAGEMASWLPLSSLGPTIAKRMADWLCEDCYVHPERVRGWREVDRLAGEVAFPAFAKEVHSCMEAAVCGLVEAMFWLNFLWGALCPEAVLLCYTL